MTMIEGQTLLNIREVNSYQSEEIRSMKDRIRLLETQEFPFVRHRDFDTKGDLIVGSADNTYDNLVVGMATNGSVLQVDSTQTLGIKWATVPTAGLADLSVTTAKLADGAVTTIKITDANVTNAKLANMADATVKGRALSAGTGVPVDLTAAQVTAIVGSTSTFLKADGTVALSADWDAGLSRRIKARIIQARDANGLGLYEDGGTLGLNISNNGDVTGSTGKYIAFRTLRALDANGLDICDDAGNLAIYVADGGALIGFGTGSPASGVKTTTDGASRVRQTGSTRYRFDLNVAAARAKFTAYDDTGSAYIPLDVESSTFNFNPSGGSSVLAASSTGLVVTGTLAVGVSSPDSKAHILTASAGSVSARADAVLTVENNGDMTGVQMLAPAGSIQRIAFGDADDNDINMFQCLHSNNTYVFTLGASDSITMAANNLRPSTSGAAGLGNSSFKWDQVWANTGTIQTSDEREKRNVKPSDLGLDFITRLQPISWVFADQPAYEYDAEDGRKQVVPERKFKRPHYGLGAQQVRKVLDDLGVADFAGYIHDADADVYALRYNEFIAPLIMAVQELAEQIKELKNGPGKTH